MLAFIENQEIVKILRDIFILEAEINKFKIIKTQLEKNLSELELEYKTKLSSKLGSDPDLLDLRRTIDKKREEFQNILSQIRESNLKKSNLFEELELNSKINLREKTNIERSFESKARSIVKENSFHRNQETQNFLKGSMLIETIPKEKTSHYETYKQMKKTFTADKNQANIWSQTNKTAPTVIFSPTNENNIKLKKMMESDQKKLEEKFGPNKIYGD